MRPRPNRPWDQVPQLKPGGKKKVEKNKKKIKKNKKNKKNKVGMIDKGYKKRICEKNGIRM